MKDNITSIQDPTVYIKPGKKLIEYLKDTPSIKNGKSVPKNIKNAVDNKKTLLKDTDLEWLNQFLSKQRQNDPTYLLTGKELYDTLDSLVENKFVGFDFDGYMEEKNKNEKYLHEILSDSSLVLPENEVIKRNPELSKRIERLKREQEERDYQNMVKNIDTSKKRMPEDSISFQMKMMNRHLIAVLQFLVSVGAGFAFGFIGIELIIGDLNFGVRLLLGISCAIVIAIAEFYFLAKHLNEEEKDAKPEIKKPEKKPIPIKKKGKVHKD